MLQVCERLVEKVIEVKTHAVAGPAAFRGDGEHRGQNVLHLTGEEEETMGQLNFLKISSRQAGDVTFQSVIYVHNRIFYKKGTPGTLRAAV